MEAFQKRCYRIIEVIDDALNSENLRDRIWAVEQLLKRIKLENTSSSKKEYKLHPTTLKGLSDEELMNNIQEMLTDESNNK